MEYDETDPQSDREKIFFYLRWIFSSLLFICQSILILAYFFLMYKFAQLSDGGDFKRKIYGFFGLFLVL